MSDQTLQAIRDRLDKIAPFPWCVIEEESAIDVRLNTFAICDAKDKTIAVKIAKREIAEQIVHLAAEGQALREERDAAWQLIDDLATLSDASIDEGDPALFGSFRDSARQLMKKLGRA